MIGFKPGLVSLSIAIALGVGATSSTAAVSGLTPIGRYSAGAYNQSAAEIVAYDKHTQRLFVVNAQSARVDVLDISDPTTPTKLGEIDPAAADGANFSGGSANSVAVMNGIMAVAIEASPKTDNGIVAFYDARTLAFINSVGVGALPDMLTFTPDGSKVLVANEGEPNDAYDIDPEGSVSIIDISNGVADATVQHATFTAFNAQEATLKSAGVRIYGPGASVAQDLEPEYIAVSGDSTTAWVTLQENNAVAILDIASATFTDIKPLGWKDHSVVGNGLDPSDEDSIASGNSGAPNIQITTRPVRGMYQPDTIAAYIHNDQTYLVTANEGDARDYAGFSEEVRIRAHCGTLDPQVFADAADLVTDAQLGRLRITSTPNGGYNSKNGSNECEVLYSYGARSFTIWNADITLAYDSGDDFEQTTAALYPANFNASNTNNDLDSRSASKGPEPEGVAIGEVEGATYAFIGLERVGGVMVYDITDPAAVSYVAYANNRDFTIVPGTPPDAGTASTVPGGSDAGDLGPEGLTFISAAASPNGYPLLVVGNEISGTTTVFRVDGATQASDDVPNAFTFASQTGVATSAVVTSDSVTPSGYDRAATISISGGEYSVNGAPFTADAGYITPGDSVRVRVTAASSANSSNTATLEINGVTATFTVTTTKSGGGALGWLGLSLLAVPLWRTRRTRQNRA